MIHLSVVCCGRAVPLLWRVLDHCDRGGQGVQTTVTESTLAVARTRRRQTSGGSRQCLLMTVMRWLQTSGWHYCLRVPSDVLLHGPRRYPTDVATLYPRLGEAAFYRNVGLWSDGCHRCSLVLASPQGVKEPRAVITDEPPSLQILWQYALRFRVEELLME